MLLQGDFYLANNIDDKKEALLQFMDDDNLTNLLIIDEKIDTDIKIILTKLSEAKKLYCYIAIILPDTSKIIFEESFVDIEDKKNIVKTIFIRSSLDEIARYIIHKHWPIVGFF
jgi:hypothetical protein